MDPKLEDLFRRIELENESTPFWIVGPQTGQFLHDLVLKERPELILEIGTSVGYSALWMASALEAVNQGLLITVESHAERFNRAKAHFEEARLSHRIQQVKGHAPEVLDEILAQKTLDLAFFDATKHEHPLYFEAVFPRLKKGGLLVIDNVESHHFGQMERFLNELKVRADLQTETLSIGAGLLLARKS